MLVDYHHHAAFYRAVAMFGYTDPKFYLKQTLLPGFIRPVYKASIRIRDRDGFGITFLDSDLKFQPVYNSNSG